MARRSKSRSNYAKFDEYDDNVKNKKDLTKKISHIQLKPFVARHPEQSALLKAIHENPITFIKGPPGTGKTMAAVAYGLQHIAKGDYDCLIFSRPAVAAEENLGFLPGTLKQKIEPYMIPIWDNIAQLAGPRAKEIIQPNGDESLIKILPIGYMRGITYHSSYVVIDEAQNVTAPQMRMILTRLGEGSKLVLCGDVKQSDIKKQNGLSKCFDILKDIEGIAFIEMTAASIVRHPLVAAIEERFEQDYDDSLKKKSFWKR